MGEIADMMLEGDLCAGCGSYIDDSGGDGFPRYCSRQCAEDCGVTFASHSYLPSPSRAKKRRAERANREQQAPNKTLPCPHCARKFASAHAVMQHAHDKHGVAL